MNFFDTSVFVASVLRSNPNHTACLERVVHANKASCATSAHSVTEVYSVLTRFPGPELLTPREALSVIDLIHARFRVFALSSAEHFDVVRQVAKNNLAGAVVHDAVILECAVKAGAKVFYTLNPKDFRRVRPEWAGHVQEP